MCLCKPEIRTPWCDDCQTFAYKRIKDLESTTLELQSELSRKKMSLSVACNRVEELEGKLKVAADALNRLAKAGDGTCGDKHASFYDCLPTLQIEFSERKQLAIDTLEQLGELK